MFPTNEAVGRARIGVDTQGAIAHIEGMPGPKTHLLRGV